MQEVKLNLYKNGEENFEEVGLSFAERRALAKRQRLSKHAMVIVTALLTLMVGVLSLKMYGMSSTIAELRAANVDSVPARPDYFETSQAFVGGYTLYGHVLTDNGELTSFNVAQECICECNGTSTGIFCRGANPMREFLAVASTEPGVEGWKMSKFSVGHGDSWRTTARFGSTPGGHHSTAGQTHNPGGPQDAISIYRSWNSAIGCGDEKNFGDANGKDDKAGARECLTICAAYDLPTEPIRRKCGF